MTKKIGIYKITNTINDKMYIGSSIDIQGRWREHKNDLKNDKHHSQHLQRAWNKYNGKNFVFSIIEECEREETLNREQYYLDLYKSYDSKFGYNMSHDALAPMMGRKFSEKSKKKLSEGVRSRDASCWTRGEDKWNAKFKNEDIINIKRMIYEGSKLIDIANLYEVAPNIITNIKTGDRYSDLKTEYDDLIIQTPKQKLSESDIIEIKKLLVDNELTLKQIGEIYDVTFAMISLIKRLKIYIDIGKEYNEGLKSRSNVRKLNKNTVKEIKLRFKQGESDKKIAEIYNVSRATISYIREDKIWREVS